MMEMVITLDTRFGQSMSRFLRLPKVLSNTLLVSRSANRTTLPMKMDRSVPPP